MNQKNTKIFQKKLNCFEKSLVQERLKKLNCDEINKAKILIDLYNFKFEHYNNDENIIFKTLNFMGNISYLFRKPLSKGHVNTVHMFDRNDIDKYKLFLKNCHANIKHVIGTYDPNDYVKDGDDDDDDYDGGSNKKYKKSRKTAKKSTRKYKKSRKTSKKSTKKYKKSRKTRKNK